MPWNPLTPAVGLLPQIIRDDDPRPAHEQLQDRYAHGGGYRPFGADKWKLKSHMYGGVSLCYPGDPDLKEISRIRLHLSNEVCVLFETDMLLIAQDDDSFAVTRVD